ncbi:MAG: hypothetical protein ACYS8W_19475 [Planctomycetota bacterium]|jgi:heme A synthase
MGNNTSTQTAKPSANVKWQIGKLSVGGGALFLLLAVLVMLTLGRTAKNDPKSKAAPLLFVLMIGLGILGAVLVLGGLIFLAMGLSAGEKTSELPIKEKTSIVCSGFSGSFSLLKKV